MKYYHKNILRVRSLMTRIEMRFMFSRDINSSVKSTKPPEGVMQTVSTTV
jgi:hypothetical protein